MAWWGPYPGRGPWRHLPPWERPGWVFRGRGWCWWYWWYWGWRPYQYATGAEALRSYKEWLEKYVKELEEEVGLVREELKRVEDRLKSIEEKR